MRSAADVVGHSAQHEDGAVQAHVCIVCGNVTQLRTAAHSHFTATFNSDARARESG